MFEDQYVTRGTLKEFCEFELNKRFYDYYHQVLRPNFDVEIDLVDFFKELYSDVSVFYFNYLDLPHDVDQYLEKKFGHESITEQNAISIELRYTLFKYIATVMTIQHKIGDLGEIESLELSYNPPVYDSFWKFHRDYNPIFLEKMSSKKDEFMHGFFDRIIENVDEVKLKKYVLGLTSKQTRVSNSESFELDLINSTGTEKIVMLHELGVLDFMRKMMPFSNSTNSLAKVLSIITGEKQSSIQAMINPIINPSTSQKNNPLTSTRPVNKIRQQLNDIGFYNKQDI